MRKNMCHQLIKTVEIVPGRFFTTNFHNKFSEAAKSKKILIARNMYAIILTTKWQLAKDKETDFTILL